MPYHHETGSMRRYSGGYGTIDITLSNYSNLFNWLINLINLLLVNQTIQLIYHWLFLFN